MAHLVHPAKPALSKPAVMHAYKYKAKIFQNRKFETVFQ